MDIKTLNEIEDQVDEIKNEKMKQTECLENEIAKNEVWVKLMEDKRVRDDFSTERNEIKEKIEKDKRQRDNLEKEIAKYNDLMEVIERAKNSPKL